MEFDRTKRGVYYSEADAIDPNSDLYHRTLNNFLLTIDILLIILVMFVILKFTPVAYLKVLQNTQTNSGALSIYLTVVLFSCVYCTLVFLSYLFWVVMIIAVLSGANWGIGLTRTNALPLVAGLILLPLFALLQLGACIRVIRFNAAHINIPKLFCCSCSHGNQLCCLGQSRWEKVIETFSLWITVMVIQSLSFSLMGLGIQCAAAPLPTIGAMTLVGSILFLAVIVIAHIVQTVQSQSTLNLVTAIQLILEILVTLIILTIVALSLVVYIAYTTSRQDTTAIGSFVAAVASTLLVGGVILLAKTRLLTQDKNGATPSEENSYTSNESETESFGKKVALKTLESVSSALAL